MTRFSRPLLLLSVLVAGTTGLMIAPVGPAGAAERETVATVMVAPAARTAVETAAPAVAAPAALSSSRPTALPRAPTVNQQRPLNDDLARFTRAF